MKEAKKVRITKCYLIELCDSEGKEITSDFCFLPYHKAKEQGEKMKADHNRRLNYGKIHDTDH